MGFTYLIEIAVPAKTDTTERGRVLERFGSRFLQTQGFNVKEQVRLTASEVDLLGSDKATGELVFVECKAFRSTNIAAEVLQKLLGNVTFHDFSSGWLVSATPLSKDAKGFEHEWSQRSTETRRKLRIFPPDMLIGRLVDARLIVSAESLQYDTARYRAGNEAFLLLTQNGEFWALPIIDPATGIRSAALLFSADDGRPIQDNATLTSIASTDTTLSLPWISDFSVGSRAVERLHFELESIVNVPMADHWTDYRPARPEDFVGRENIQTDVLNFLDSVREGNTTTRLVALKGPSGWGKSSSLLKIASRAISQRNSKKYFVFTVDSRAATTRRFPELALISAIKAAIDKGFVSAPSDLEFGGASGLFLTPSIKHICRNLANQKKVICIFFDQFEELLHKVDLSEVFHEMRRVCTSVEEAQANIVIGFSWKTDGVIPADHNAYHMWHTLADRRFEIELPPFSEREVVLAINRFVKELGHPIVPQLKRVLQDHCQGFPWLLKKLCVHIFEQSKRGIEQSDILTSSLNIQALFKRDLENLSLVDVACIKQIAMESPAEFFRIAQDFGHTVVSQLIDKRLVIRSGARLTLYWDIFRDYILTERIPHIPVTYIPQANFSRYAKSLVFMNGKSELSYAELAAEMNLSMGAADNLVRDLVNLGHVDAHRKENLIHPTYSNQAHAINIAFGFWRSHEVVQRLLVARPNGATFTEAEFVSVYQAANRRSKLEEDTVYAYAQRTLRWLVGIALVRQSGDAFKIAEGPRSGIASLDDISTKIREGSNFFLGEAPPAHVVNAFRALCSGTRGRAEIGRRFGRNTCYALMKLGLMTADGNCTTTTKVDAAEAEVMRRARSSSTIRYIGPLDPAKLSPIQIGDCLSEHFNMDWSKASKKRYGNALKQWARWSSTSPEELQQNSISE